MISSMILGSIWATVLGFLATFWQWIAGACIVVLGFMFSPTIRKYTIGAIAVALLVGLVYMWGYNSNDTVQVITHTCDEFRKWLVSGPATDKALAIFKRHDLCI